MVCVGTAGHRTAAGVGRETRRDDAHVRKSTVTYIDPDDIVSHNATLDQTVETTSS